MVFSRDENCLELYARLLTCINRIFRGKYMCLRSSRLFTNSNRFKKTVTNWGMFTEKQPRPYQLVHSKFPSNLQIWVLV